LPALVSPKALVNNNYLDLPILFLKKKYIK
jgi:hypothetical protein